jgi:paraquat-inducible protein B
VSDSPQPKPAVPEFRAAQRWNIVWVVPILAVLIGGWLIYHNLASRGPVAKVRFETADGIAAGKTEVRCRSVRVGLVKEVELAADLKSVLVSIQMEPKGATLLRKETRFWVVRPRVSGTDVSGLGTLLTGAYIELEPGSGPAEGNEFPGLETPPPTSQNVPGLRLVLTAEEAGSLVAGSPIFFRGVEVGRIESRKFGPDGQDVRYDAFIHEEFVPRVKENSRFWNTSGVDISAGATGIKVRTPSFQAMVAGGASFGVPHGVEPGQPARNGMVFKLYPDEDSAEGELFDPTMQLLLLFDQSVLGLTKGSPVRFRGITIGRVLDISFGLVTSKMDPRIPVLVELDPALLCRGMQEPNEKADPTVLPEVVNKGLRAALKTESYLTGSLYVDLDCYPDAPPAKVEQFGNLAVLPTVPGGGVAQLEASLSAMLVRLQALPLDDLIAKFGTAADEAATTIAAARTSLEEVNATAAAARKILDDPAVRGVPADLRTTLDNLQKTIASIGPDGAIQGDLLRTLDELRGSLRSIKSLSTTLEDKPSSLLFGRDSSGNPTPRAPRGNR